VRRLRAGACARDGWSVGDELGVVVALFAWHRVQAVVFEPSLDLGQS